MLLAATHPSPRFLVNQRFAPAALIEAAVDPVVAVGTLLACIFVFQIQLDGPYLVLIFIVLTLMFPGRFPVGTRVGTHAINILTGWAVIATVLFLQGWATQMLGYFDRRTIVAWLLVTPVALFGTHLFLPRLLSRLMAVDGVSRAAVIVGAGELGRQLATSIETTPSLGIRFAGYFDDRMPTRLTAVARKDVLGPLTQLASFAKTRHIDLIYVTLPLVSHPRICKLLDELRDTTVSIYFVPDIFLFDPIQARMDTINGIPVVAICETPFYGVNAVIKRISDLILSSMILALISPLLLAIAAGVKFSSKGPVLFKQRRYGLDGREIVVYKFRTMTVMEDGDAIKQVTRDDPRVTRFGAFLRRFSLDELPQFFNVLQGCMSVVGPRPHAVVHNEIYRKLIKGYMIRHKVKPGITGWAQVNGLRGETDQLNKMQARVEYDLAYLRSWSLLLDLRIVLKTVFVVLQKQNAY